MCYIKPRNGAFRCNAVRGVAVLRQAAWCRVLHRGSHDLGLRCAQIHMDSMCDLVDEPQATLRFQVC